MLFSSRKSDALLSALLYNTRQIQTNGDFNLGISSFHSGEYPYCRFELRQIVNWARNYVHFGGKYCRYLQSSFFFLLIIWRSACLWAKALSLPWLQNNLLFTRGLSAPSTTPNLEGEGRSLSVIMLKNCPARMAPTTTGLAAAYASG